MPPAHHSPSTTPAQHSTTTATQPDPHDLADLDALAAELNRLRFHALLLTPPGEPPYVDVSPPGDLNPGQRIYVHAGMYLWPIAPTSQPHTAGAAIAHTLHHSTGDQQRG